MKKEIYNVLIGINELISFTKGNYHYMFANNTVPYNSSNINLEINATNNFISHMTTKQKSALKVINSIENTYDYEILKRICFNAMDEDYNKWIARLEDDLEKLISCLEIYLSKFVNKEQLTVISPDIKALSIDKIINFNYTDTYIRCNRYHQDVEIDYIHGKAKAINNDNNLVLGIDEYLSGEEKNKNLKLVKFKKYYQRIVKRTGCKNKNWIFRIKESKEPSNVYIFGHSLDITDKDILRDLILNDNVKTTIFYLDEESFKKQVINLIAVIGQEELITRVSGQDATIEFRLQQKMIEI